MHKSTGLGSTYYKTHAHWSLKNSFYFIPFKKAQPLKGLLELSVQTESTRTEILLGAPLIYHRETTKNLGTLLRDTYLKEKGTKQKLRRVLDSQPRYALSKEEASDPTI